MKLYLVQVIDGEKSGGVDGPNPSLQDMLNFMPNEDDRGLVFQIVESDSSSGSSTVIYDWSWDTEEWIRSKMKISVVFGAKSPPLSEQLAGFDLDPEKIKHWQKDADAIARLSVRGILSESETEKARKRLVNRIARSE
jgi:hypothetical protein